MTGKTHKIVGMATGMTVANIVLKGNDELINSCFLVAASYYGSSLPDIDVSKRVISISPFTLLSRKIYRFVAKCAVGFGNDVYFANTIKHRGIMHSLFIFPPIAMIFLIINFLLKIVMTKFIDVSIITTYINMIFIGMVCGVLSHIFLDMLNPQGICLFSPLSNRRYNIANIKIFSFGEALLRWLCIIILIVAILLRIYL